jgi:hypothetical protein
MESNELTQYSCTKLLREMEVAANSDSDMDEVGLGGGTKMMSWCICLSSAGKSYGSGLSPWSP